MLHVIAKLDITLFKNPEFISELLLSLSSLVLCSHEHPDLLYQTLIFLHHLSLMLFDLASDVLLLFNGLDRQVEFVDSLTKLNEVYHVEEFHV